MYALTFKPVIIPYSVLFLLKIWFIGFALFSIEGFDERASRCFGSLGPSCLSIAAFFPSPQSNPPFDGILKELSWWMGELWKDSIVLTRYWQNFSYSQNNVVKISYPRTTIRYLKQGAWSKLSQKPWSTDCIPNLLTFSIINLRFVGILSQSRFFFAWEPLLNRSSQGIP